MLLNQAENIMFGSREVQKVYLGSTLVWERAGDISPINPFRETIKEPEWIDVQSSIYDLDGMYDFLNRYAVPKFFSAVVKNEAENYVSCIYNGDEFQRFHANHSDFGEKMILNGEIAYEFNFGYDGFWKHAVIGKNCIYFLYQNDYGVHRYNGTLLTRTKSGVPVFLRCIDKDFSPAVTQYDTTQYAQYIPYLRFDAGAGAQGYYITDRNVTEDDVTFERISDIANVYLPHLTLWAWSTYNAVIVTDADGADYFMSTPFFFRI